MDIEMLSLVNRCPTSTVRTAWQTGRTADCRWALVSVQRHYWQSPGHGRGEPAEAETHAQGSGDSPGWLPCFRHFNDSVEDSSRVPRRFWQLNSYQTKKLPLSENGSLLKSSPILVAGAGFEPATFGL